MSNFSEHSWCCKRGELGAAERRLLKEAIELQPGHSPALNVLSTFLASRGRLVEAQHYEHSALAAYDAVLQSHPTWLKPVSAISQFSRHAEALDSLGQTICRAILVMDQERSRAFAKIFLKCKN